MEEKISNYNQEEPGEEQKKTSGNGKKILLMVAAVGIAFVVGRYTADIGGSGDSIITKKVVQKAEAIQQVIDKLYLEEEDVQAVQEGVYKGMVSALGDPYSVYYTKEEYDAFQESYTGEYCGIGASLLQNADTGLITIVKTFKGSPAQEAGLKTDDILYKVEGEEVTGEDLSEVVARVKGKEGTTVKVTIMRGIEEMDLELLRKTYCGI